jgi:hypothetical protein
MLPPLAMHEFPKFFYFANHANGHLFYINVYYIFIFVCFSMIQFRPKFFVVYYILKINTQFSGTVLSNDPFPAETNILLRHKHITPSLDTDFMIVTGNGLVYTNRLINVVKRVFTIEGIK